MIDQESPISLFWPGFILGTVNAIGLAAMICTFVEYCECLI